MRWPLARPSSAPAAVTLAVLALGGCTAEPSPLVTPVADATTGTSSTADAGSHPAPDAAPPELDAGLSDSGSGEPDAAVDPAALLAASGAGTLDAVLPLIQLTYAAVDTGTGARSAEDLAGRIAANLDAYVDGCGTVDLTGAQLGADLTAGCPIGPTLARGLLTLEVTSFAVGRVEIRVALAGRADAAPIQGGLDLTITGTRTRTLMRTARLDLASDGTVITGDLTLAVAQRVLDLGGTLTAGARALTLTRVLQGTDACFPSAGTVTVTEAAASVELAATVATTTSGALDVAGGPDTVALAARTACGQAPLRDGGMGGGRDGGARRDGGGGRRDAGPGVDGGDLDGGALDPDAVVNDDAAAEPDADTVDPDATTADGGGGRRDGGARRDR